METVARLIGVGVGLLATKAAEKGVTLSAEAQTAITLGVYSVVHRAFTWLVRKRGK
jgi:hypothetical protein